MWGVDGEKGSPWASQVTQEDTDRDSQMGSKEHKAGPCHRTHHGMYHSKTNGQSWFGGLSNENSHEGRPLFLFSAGGDACWKWPSLGG